MTDKKNHIEKRITLDSIEKKAVYNIRNGYFDELPTRIQNRVISTEHRNSPGFILSLSLKYALPVIALIIMSIYFVNRFENAELDVQALIDEVTTEQLVAYLNDSDISTDEILGLIDIDELDIDGMMDEEIGLLNEIELDAVLEDYQDFETDFND